MADAHIIDGRALAETIIADLRQRLHGMTKSRLPGLATILVGADPASAIYVRNKRKRALDAGMKSFHHQLGSQIAEEDLLKLIAMLNNDPSVDGILVQLPLPYYMDQQRIIEAIDPEKDVDGFHPINLGFLVAGRPRMVACTPLGILHLLRSIDFGLRGKHAVVVSRSAVVGRPMAHLLLREDATVTICHRWTKDLAHYTRQADVVITAVGIPHLIGRAHIKPGAIVIDVGINRDQNGNLCGDVDFDAVRSIASFITPVPGGVGPMTIAMLLKNTLDTFTRGMG